MMYGYDDQDTVITKVNRHYGLTHNDHEPAIRKGSKTSHAPMDDGQPQRASIYNTGENRVGIDANAPLKLRSGGHSATDWQDFLVEVHESTDEDLGELKKGVDAIIARAESVGHTQHPDYHEALEMQPVVEAEMQKRGIMVLEHDPFQRNLQSVVPSAPPASPRKIIIRKTLSKQDKTLIAALAVGVFLLLSKK
jgi:hypothetical protein